MTRSISILEKKKLSRNYIRSHMIHIINVYIIIIKVIKKKKIIITFKSKQTHNYRSEISPITLTTTTTTTTRIK